MQYHTNELRQNIGCNSCRKPCAFNGNSVSPDSKQAANIKDLKPVASSNKYGCNTSKYKQF